MPDLIQLGGRGFRPLLQSTVEHDFWLLGRLRKAGLDRIEVAEGEDADAIANRIVSEAAAAGVAFECLGALLLPEGVSAEAWTPALAAETAAHLRGLSAEQDKINLRAALATMVLGFFRNGLVRFVTSPKSSGSASPANHESRITNHENEAPGTTAPGAGSFLN